MHLYNMCDESRGRLTSPIMTASVTGQLISSSIALKKDGSGFPTTSALHPLAYSRAATKGPGPRASPSDLL